MSLSTQSAPSPSPPGKGSGEGADSGPQGNPVDGDGALQPLPQQAGELALEMREWLATDSFGALAGLAVGIGFYFLLVLVRGWFRRRLSGHADFGTWGWVALRVVSRTRGLFLFVASAAVVAHMFDAPSAWAGLIAFLFTIAAAVQGAFWAREFLVSLVERKAAGREADATMSSAVGVLTILINVVVWATAAIILLDNLGVNVTGLVAGLGIGGIAIGLAAQGIFSDLFAALSILLDQPFKKGDAIQVGGPQGVIGVVEHIGLKTTRLRALSGEIVILSNANMLSQQINNFAAFEDRRVVMILQIIYQTDPDTLQAIPGELMRIVESVPNCRFERAHFIQFGASSLDYELVFCVEQPGFEEMMDARQAVGFAILRRFRALGIDFAFPAQTSYLAGPDGRIVDPRPDAEGRAGPPGRPGTSRKVRPPPATRGKPQD